MAAWVKVAPTATAAHFPFACRLYSYPATGKALMTTVSGSPFTSLTAKLLHCRTSRVFSTAGGPLINVKREIIDTALEQAREVSNGMGPHQLIWPGLLRRGR
jgi:hypothetical protein